MSDITMCVNSTCLLRQDCLRYRIIAETHQVYAFYEPCPETTDCHHFVRLRPWHDAIVSLDVADARRGRLIAEAKSTPEGSN